MRIMEVFNIVLFSVLVSVCSGDGHFYLTYRNGSDFNVIKSGSPPNTVGLEWTTRSYFNNSINAAGWDILEIFTNPELNDSDQAFQAGWIEGYLTQVQIYYHWYNTQRKMCKVIPKTCGNIRDYFNTNWNWIKSQIVKNGNDPYWHQVKLYYLQIDGLYQGYQDALDTKTGQNITLEDIIWLNFVTDIMTLKDSLGVKSERKNIHKTEHCSVLIKILPGFSDVFFGHNAWISYNFMNRIIKRYNFAYRWTLNSTKLIPGQNQAFSSYPGVITSIDDFYIINSGLVVTETTNEVYDNEVYKNNKPKGQVLESVRSMVANRLANDIQSWSYYFSQMNSGTYNNQWMVIDLKKFTPGFEPKSGFFLVLEQMPGLIESQDQTKHLLAYSYWASYNIPFYKNIYKYAAYDVKEKMRGSYFSYKDCARAKIFQREHVTVVDLESMIKVIRYNDYKNDPYSKCNNCTPKENACLSIASRCDLNPKTGSYPMQSLAFKLEGAIDAKIGSYSMFKRGEMVAIAGPTRSHGNLPPFRWSSYPKVEMSHMGQPDVWDFNPIITSWMQPYRQTNPNEREIRTFHVELTFNELMQ